MSLRNKIIELLKANQDKNKQAKQKQKIYTEEEFNKALEEQVNKALEEEISKLDNSFYEEVSKLINPIDNTKEEKSTEEKIKEILKGEINE